MLLSSFASKEAEGQEGSPTPRPDGPGPGYYMVVSRILQMDFRESPKGEVRKILYLRSSQKIYSTHFGE
jgi:hypothetical protein